MITTMAAIIILVLPFILLSSHAKKPALYVTAFSCILLYIENQTALKKPPAILEFSAPRRCCKQYQEREYLQTSRQHVKA